MLPLSLYIHMPWCIKKCPYCDFNSHKMGATMPEQEYIDALIADLAQHHALHGHRPINSIFIGGGTPSLFTAKSYEQLFRAIRQSWTFSENIEITMEANPSSVEAKRFKDYRAIGINRLSLGVQSFDDASLKDLGRVHDSNSAKKAIEAIKAAGFDNFNIDIMHGLPNQTVEKALDDLNQALSFSPTHLSWYQLTIEPNTYFYRHKPHLPSDDTLAVIEKEGHSLLQTRLNQYEISAFSLGDRQSQHNLNYWRFGDYLGIGAGAHGKLSLDGKVTRTQKKRMPKDYMTSTLSKDKRVSNPDLAFEFMLNYTRLKEPILKSHFLTRTFLHLDTIKKPLERALYLDLLTEDQASFMVTQTGHQYLNDLQALFLSGDEKN